MNQVITSYLNLLKLSLDEIPKGQIAKLGHKLFDAWINNRNIFICGNGGSAANAIHLANDFIYGAGVSLGRGLKVEALSANSAVITCLANDLGYEYIFSEQLKAKAKKNDLLIALSGSGNSKNVINAIEFGNSLDMDTFAIVGFTGGKCRELAKNSIHCQVNDMQISEDLQLVIGHMCMQWLCKQNF